MNLVPPAARVSRETSMKRQCWLRPNRIGLLVGLLVPLALLLVAGVVLALGYFLGFFTVAGVIAAVLLGAALLIGAMQLRAALTPRLAYGEGKLHVAMGTLRPQTVPIEVVECFFIGQGSTLLAGTQGESPKSITLIVRLAEKEKQWHVRPAQPQLGEWRDGYIILRGTWCERITLDLVHRLNQQLAQAQREWKARQAAAE